MGFFRPHVPLYVPKSGSIFTMLNGFLPDNPISDSTIFKNFLALTTMPGHDASLLEQGNDITQLTSLYQFRSHCVGIVLDALESAVSDNTIVVLWSDHVSSAETTLGQARFGRSACRFAGPGIESGDATKEPASLIDIFPTLVELCQLSENPHLEGISLVPQLDNPETPREQPAITSSYFGNHSIRTRDWRLIVYEDGAKELYDHRNDQDEFHNLAADPAHQDTIERLSQWLPQNAAREFREVSERVKTRAN